MARQSDQTFSRPRRIANHAVHASAYYAVKAASLTHTDYFGYLAAWTRSIDYLNASIDSKHLLPARTPESSDVSVHDTDHGAQQ
jgi:hypothetical protein